MSARVLVLHTGGTIGMAASPEGFCPMPDFAAQLRRMPATGTDVPAFDVVELGKPIDSANLCPTHWSAIARTLVECWDAYAGFVVLHGTDTLAWSASALSFMLRGGDKPVILTGAQIPWLAPRSDAPANLQSALCLAVQPALREVAVFFGRQLLRGNRSRKLDSTAFDAFGSPNYPPLATVGIDVRLHADHLLPPGECRFVVPDFDPEAVAVLTLHPGLSARNVEATLANPRTRGLILQSYGVGNVPIANTALLAALTEAIARGVIVLNTTQCLRGRVAQEAYATGSPLTRIGVIAGADLTPEAAFAKLHFLLASERDPDAVKRQLGHALCGEHD